MTCWVLAHEIGRNEEDEPIYEYFTGTQGDAGRPSRSPFRADAYKFTSSTSALECANTHLGMVNSEQWRILPVRQQQGRR